MDREQILETLKLERAKLDAAIEALEGISESRPLVKGRVRRQMSQAARNKIAKAQKLRWEKQKKAEKKESASVKKAASKKTPEKQEAPKEEVTA